MSVILWYYGFKREFGILIESPDFRTTDNRISKQVDTFGFLNVNHIKGFPPDQTTWRRIYSEKRPDEKACPQHAFSPLLKGVATDCGESRQLRAPGVKIWWRELILNRSIQQGMSTIYIILPRNQVVCKGFDPAQREIAIRRLGFEHCVRVPLPAC